MSTANGAPPTSTPSSSSPTTPFSVYSPSRSSLTPSHPPRVLSIQSSVVYGYVGNKASIFPLQLLGFDVDPIHTCQLSNHTGYKVHTGRRTNGEELAELIRGLRANGMMAEYHLVVSGYMGSVELMQRWIEVTTELVQGGQVQLYLCDPVMGDGGRLYVPREFVSLYQQLLPHAQVVTPNQTEAELLTGRKIASLDDAIAVCEALHTSGVKAVIITSLDLPEDHLDGADHPSHIHIIATQSAPLFPPPPSSFSSASSPASSHLIESGYFHLRVPFVSGYWSGTGDLTSSLLLGWLWRTQGDLGEALSMTISSVQAVMRRTAESGGSELQLIAAQLDLQKPRDSGIAIIRAEWRERQKR